MSHEIVIETHYGLHRHLKCCCEVMPEYELLIHALALDSIFFGNMLETIPIFYGSYSKHDITHSNAIISYIELFLGEERIKRLSPTDTWLIIMAANAHDIGMMITAEDLENLWKEEYFVNHVDSLRSSPYENLSDAAKYFFDEKTDALTAAGKIWESSVRPNDCAIKAIIKYAWSASLLIADFHRKHHAENARKRVLKNSDILAHNEYIPNRLIGIIAECAACHGVDNEDIIRRLDPKTNGFRNDYAHPRFVASLLRLGDVLDIDSNRFNPYMANVYGGMPDDSKVHRFKHAATDHILVTPEYIEVRANLDLCDINVAADEILKKQLIDVFKVVHGWFDLIENEAKFINKYWFQIVPDNFTGRAPWLKKREIIIGKETYSQESILSSFSISYDRAFSIIQSKNNYDESLVFCREIVQNAFDATKIQLFRVFADKNVNPCHFYRQVDKREKVMNPSKIELFAQILPWCICDEYSVLLSICENSELFGAEDKELRFCVCDNGTGIGQDSMQRLKSVGEQQSEERLIEVRNMPGWLKPTGEFGIGLHSAFAYTDEIYISTFSPKDGTRAQFNLRSKNSGGTVVTLPKKLQGEERYVQGTTVIVNVKKENLTEISPASTYDAPSIDYLQLCDQIIDELFNIFSRNITPLVIKIWGKDAKNPYAKHYIPSLFEGLAKMVYKNRSVYNKHVENEIFEECKDKLKSTIVGDCVLWKEIACGDRNTSGLKLFGLSGCTNMENDETSRTMVLETSFMPLNDFATNKCHIAYKGSYVKPASGENDMSKRMIDFPYTNTTIHILGRKASKTVTAQRDRLLNEAVQEIKSDAWNTMNTILTGLLKQGLKDGMASLVEQFRNSGDSLALYLLRWQWITTQQSQVDSELIDFADKAIGELAQYRTTPIAVLELSDNVLYQRDLGFSEFLHAPLSLYYLGKGERFLSANMLSKVFSGHTEMVIANDFWSGMNANLYLDKVCVLQNNLNNEKIYAFKYAKESAITVEISDEELKYLIEDQASKGARYIPCFNQYEVLATKRHDRTAIEKWHYCHIFVQLPNCDQFTNAEQLKINKLFFANGQLKASEGIDFDAFSNIFCDQIDQIYRTQYTPEKYTKDIIAKAYLKLVLQAIHKINKGTIERLSTMPLA